MATINAQSVRTYVLEHLLESLERTPSHDEPFSHFYVENVFPDDVYVQMMDDFPAPDRYKPLDASKYHNDKGISTRDVFSFTPENLADLPLHKRELWSAVADAMHAPEVKQVVFRKLATDLSARFGMPKNEVENITSYSKPSLFRDLDGYEIAPHPDGRAKIVTMQLYLPRDRSQLELGTALYRRRFHSPAGVYSWHGRFEKVKQFVFAPNTGYAFAVSNSWSKKSWHGRESLPAGCGARNTLLNIFFASNDRTY
ncbi:MAG TPA: hypothetical protein VHX65_03910 [Pirellulales bacterium]|jgi:hypothetical protein|nr:hypothetical protein [Pirellulales bacterium]